MPSILARSGATETQTKISGETKKKFRTVLGLSSFNPTVAAPGSAHTFKHSNHKGRHSVDVTSPTAPSAASTYRKHKSRADRASVTEVSFYEPDSAADFMLGQSVPTLSTTMKNMEVPQERASRRKIAAQDGPWSVSVAYDKKGYNIYIKTPTHHLTLTRTASEIIDLHNKLSSAHPDLTLPVLPQPLQDENMENGNALNEKKRKSSFLHTLSRLASPGPSRRERPKEKDVKSAASTTPSSRNSLASAGLNTPTLPTPTASPSKELADPFLSPLSASTSSTGGNSTTVTALAAYLTTLSNEPVLKQSKSWRRFVRVRTDDLESERVERAVKRVRSDLAAHLGGGLIGMVMGVPRSEARDGDADETEAEEKSVTEEVESNGLEPSSEEAVNGEPGELGEEGPKKVVVEEVPSAGDDLLEPNNAADVPEDAPVPELETPAPIDTNISSLVNEHDPDKEETVLPTPVASPTSPTSSHAHTVRIPRSQSADPDKATRLSRVFQSSPLKDDDSAAESDSEALGDGTEGVSTTTLEDDSSASMSVHKRKKTRSASDLRSKEKRTKKVERKTVVDDFEMMRVLGKGCAGKVLLVRHKKQESLYALKAITKRHVLAHQELQHTRTEQSVLKRMAREAKDPFVVRLHWSFHDKDNLFLVMDFHPGGDLATQLARWGRLGRDRARFYAAEIVEGVDGLHAAGVIYRDLKPENILIGADGHIVLTDFGLSKEFSRRSSSITSPPTPTGSRDFYASLPGTPQPNLPYWMQGEGAEVGWPGQAAGQNDSTTTFCGTAEYLAPEVIQGLPYSYEVDWWSFGTMLYEMLTGITPFWASNHSDMYVRVLQDELKFPDDRAIDQDTKSLIRGLLQRNPALRMKQPRIKRHPYFSMIDWSHVYFKRYIPPYIPPIDPSNASDTQNFDDAFLDMEPVIDNEPEQTDSDKGGEPTDTEKTDGEDSVRTPAQSRSPSVHPMPQDEDGPDLFDGYSFKGRNSVLIDDEEEEEESEEEIDEGYIPDEVTEDVTEAMAAPEVTLPAAVNGHLSTEELTPEPKTPEQRKVTLPEPPVVVEVSPESAAIADVPVVEEVVEEPPPQPLEPTSGSVDATPKGDKQVLQASETTVSPVETASAAVPEQSKANPLAAARVVAPTRVRGRREKSGVPALDRYLSDTIDEDDEVTEREDDDDWDFVEAPGGEERNGAKGTSLFARGVVDRYKLAVFRKASTPGRNNASRNFSGNSFESEVNGSEPSASPTPSDKHRRGRNPALTFRKNPKQFLRARSPPSISSARSSGTSRTLMHSNSATISASTASSTGLLTPSPSTGPSTATTGPSLKSKESATSVGSPASSSDQSVNGDGGSLSQSAVELASKTNGSQTPESKKRPSQSSLGDEPEKPKGTKLKKYKEGAEKVLSLFASPRQSSQGL